MKYQSARRQSGAALLPRAGVLPAMLNMPASISILPAQDSLAESFGGGGTFRGVGVQLTHTYDDIISIDNLFDAWREFLRGKQKRRDVQEFGYHLVENIKNLHSELLAGKYLHGGYEHFRINDPKPRDIHKASVRDRLVHHAIYRVLYPLFDKTFIADSYSCRLGKGTHKAVNRFRECARKVSRNDTRTCWVLKCDIRKFFASIDQRILLEILHRHIGDKRTLSLLTNIITSFCSTPGVAQKGLPLGNLTSQLLVNVYMNEFDQFVKHRLKAKYYIRYADDFVILSLDKGHLLEILPYMEVFLHERLKLRLHPNKVSTATLASGIDFLGWVHFPDHRVLRAATKRRMFRRIMDTKGKKEVVQSYLGLLSHGNAHKLAVRVAHPAGLAK